jgi:hypothetical protein
MYKLALEVLIRVTSPIIKGMDSCVILTTPASACTSTSA